MSLMNTEEKICVILNPKAGDGKAGKKAAQIKQYLSQYFENWDLKQTKAPRHAIQLAKEATDLGFNIVTAVGGDGSCHEVVNGIMESEKKAIFTLIPFGTGSDLRKTLNVPNNIEQAIKIAAHGTDRSVDVGVAYVTTDDGPKNKYFINVAGFGANGAVVEKTNKESKRWGGRITFLKATLHTTMTYQAPKVQMYWENEGKKQEWNGELLSCFIANAQFCGGGMKVAPQNSICDQNLHLTILPNMSVPQQIYNIPKLYNGRISKVPNSVCNPIQELKAAALQGIKVQIDLDGELGGRLPATFSIAKQALTVRSQWQEKG
jgi:diacylglycerol kinase (ATP)